MSMWYLQWENSFLTIFVCMNEDYNMKIFVSDTRSLMNMIHREIIILCFFI